MKKVKVIFWLAILLAGGILVITDAFGTGRAYQYAFNAAYFILVAPACIVFSGILEWGHPEYFGK